MNALSPPSPETSQTTPALLERAISDLRELARIELRLAIEEALVEARRARRAAMLGVTAIVLSSAGLSLLTMLFVARSSNRDLAGAVACSTLFAATAGALWGAGKLWPRTPFAATRTRLRDDAERLREHVGG